MEKQHVPFGYIYKVFKFQTIDDIEICLNREKEKAGFYPYFIPQNEGLILIVATQNPEAVKFRAAKQIEANLERWNEGEVQKLIQGGIAYLKTPEETSGASLFVTWLYENEFVIGHRSDKEREAT